MKNSAILFFVLFFLVGCVKMNTQTTYNHTFKRYDKNKNKVLEENEYRSILVRYYKRLKLFKKLPNKYMQVDQYVETEFLSHDLDNDKVITWKEMLDYGTYLYYLSLDLNKNGFLEINDEFKLDLTKKSYKESIKKKLPYLKNSQNKVISFEEYKSKFKDLINPNNDDKIEFVEYMNYINNYCPCKTFEPL